MSGAEWLSDWAKKRKAKLQPSLDMMQSGQLRSWKVRRDGTRVDTTEEGIALFRDMVAELDRIIETGRP